MNTNTENWAASLSTADLVDRLGLLRSRIAASDSEERAIRAELTRREVTSASGRLFNYTISTVMRSVLDTAAVRREMGQEWCDQRCRSSISTKISVVPRAEALELAAEWAAADQSSVPA